MHFVIGARILGTYGAINSRKITFLVLNLIFMRVNINGDVCLY